GDGVDLVGEHRLGVEQEAADERRLAVVHAARSRDAEQIRVCPLGGVTHQKYPSRLRSSMAASETRSSPRVAPRSVSREAATSASTASLSVASERTAPVVE